MAPSSHGFGGWLPWWKSTGPWVVLLMALVMGAGVGVGGYYLGALRESGISVMSRQRVAPLEYFVQGASFSEVEDARALLQGSAARRVTELRSSPALEVGRRARVPVDQVEARERELDRVVAGFQGAIEEFRGTEQEGFLVQHLLWLLQGCDRRSAWIDVYLEALYRQPTQPLVGRGAVQAMRWSRALGCEARVREAFRHVLAIPLGDTARSQIAYLLGAVEVEDWPEAAAEGGWE